MLINVHWERVLPFACIYTQSLLQIRSLENVREIFCILRPERYTMRCIHFGSEFAGAVIFFPPRTWNWKRKEFQAPVSYN
jgi:hypothetical protein